MTYKERIGVRPFQAHAVPFGAVSWRPAVAAVGRLIAAAAVALLLTLFCRTASGDSREPLPNLSVTAFDVTPEPLQWGNALVVTLTVTNNGTAPSGICHLGLFLSADSTIEATDEALGNWLPQVNPLNVGQSRTMMIPGISLPIEPPAGFTEVDEVWIGAVVDVSDEVIEADEADNSNVGVDVDSDAVAVEFAPLMLLRQSMTPVEPGDSLDMGTQVIEGGTAVTLTIRNAGAADLIIGGALTFSGPDADEFRIAAAPAVVVPPTGSAPFTVLFAPTSRGEKQAILSIPNNDEDRNPYTVHFAGTALGPTLSVSHDGTALTAGSSVDVGMPFVGGFEAVMFTVANSGLADLELELPVTVGGPDADQFTVTAAPGTPVPPASSTAFSILFSPTSSGRKTATLQLRSNDEENSPFGIVLTGRGIGGVVSVRQGGTTVGDGDTQVFPDTVIGRSEVVDFTVENVGVEDLVLGTPLAVESVGVPQFTVLTQPSATVAPGASTAFSVRFVPASAGAKHGRLYIPSNDGWDVPYEVKLVGEGVSGGSVSEQTIPLVQGWNWISFHTIPENNSLDAVLSSYGPTLEDEFKTAPHYGGTATFSGGVWFGMDDGIQAGVLYQLYVQTATPLPLTVSGTRVPATMPLSLSQGSNWIGFVGNHKTAVNTAMVGYSAAAATDNDELKTQVNHGGTATFFGGIWTGTLGGGLTPGVGYKLSVQTSNPEPLVFGE